MTEKTRHHRSADGRSPDPAEPVRLALENVTVGYDGDPIIRDLTLDLPHLEFTAIIGPNGCGKSTLLKTFSRMLRPSQGRVLVDGRDMSRMSTKRIARAVGVLPQSPINPEGITVADLVSRGRYPHQHILSQFSAADERAVDDALIHTGLAELAGARLDELSGGQRQRAWIAMVLAQDTRVMLLDEPTTFLDVSTQADVLDLCASLHARGRTLVAVLHDLNMAARYATHVIAMKSGSVITRGHPEDVFTLDMLREVFDLDARILRDPDTGRPLIVPRTRRGAARRDGPSTAHDPSDKPDNPREEQP
ncbi:ABC transporter ATP-binding protein [Corynebacterium meridianum]|uniref:ABC transporter ATP-binding protein n=1 Tax=Corynebacterium meridianum TaxID=2765363 RepID=A0A934I8L6_9CORY|nr:ABC transporter ATP-binding protein [Corynebacterium meridianum]MBI8990279.1 ABC transporter ATP-binding protein [Corynebacterium meridianum]MCK7678367.1 ABC transporter ATP-binding protein [Corynebacterium meridianum]